jgi:hypothetical protein
MTADKGTDSRSSMPTVNLAHLIDLIIQSGFGRFCSRHSDPARTNRLLSLMA